MTSHEAQRLDLAANEKTPDDIFTAEFSLPVCEYLPAIAISADVSFSYTVSVGYDRTEKEEVFNKVTEKVETRYKTVTDWSPFGDSYSFSEFGMPF